MAQSIRDHIVLPWMINNLTIIILNYDKPSTLPYVQIWLIHKLFHTLVVRLDGKMDSIKIFSPNLEGKNYCPQLQIICQIPNLMGPQFPGSIYDDPTHSIIITRNL